jgi:hypothetical protein
VKPTFTERPVIRQSDEGNKIIFQCRLAGETIVLSSNVAYPEPDLVGSGSENLHICDLFGVEKYCKYKYVNFSVHKEVKGNFSNFMLKFLDAKSW